MSTIRRNKLGCGAMLLAVGLIIFILYKIFETDKLTFFLSVGISWPDETQSRKIYLKVTSSEYSLDTLDIIISPQWIYWQECCYKHFDGTDTRLQKQFIKELKDCIVNDKPMNISAGFFKELQNDNCYPFSIDEKLQQEFRVNGYKHYIEDDWIKGYKWLREPDVNILPIAGNENSWHILDNLIYFLQKEHIGVYFVEVNPGTGTDFYWGYAVTYF